MFKFLVFRAEIWKYFGEKYNPDTWYPADSNIRNNIETMITWYISTVHKPVENFVEIVVFQRIQAHGQFVNTPLDNKQVKQAREQVEATLAQLEKDHLKYKQYMCESGISFADVVVVCDLVNLRLAKFDFSAFSGIQNYMNGIIPLIQGWDDVHTDFEHLLKEVHASLLERGKKKKTISNKKKSNFVTKLLNN